MEPVLRRTLAHSGDSNLSSVNQEGEGIIQNWAIIVETSIVIFGVLMNVLVLLVYPEKNSTFHGNTERTVLFFF